MPLARLAPKLLEALLVVPRLMDQAIALRTIEQAKREVRAIQQRRELIAALGISRRGIAIGKSGSERAGLAPRLPEAG